MVDPEGAFSVPLNNLRKTIASSATFRTLTGAADEAEALGKIFYFEKDNDEAPDDFADFAHAIVEFPEDYDLEIASSSGWEVQSTLKFNLIFNENSGELTTQGKHLWGCNQIGKIVDEMKANTIADRTNYLSIARVMVVGFGELDEDQFKGNHLYAAELLVEWIGI